MAKWVMNLEGQWINLDLSYCVLTSKAPNSDGRYEIKAYFANSDIGQEVLESYPNREDALMAMDKIFEEGS